MKKNLIPLTILGAIIIIMTACPYASKVPIDSPSVKVTQQFTGKWLKASDKEKENPEYYVISGIDEYKYNIVKFEYQTSDSSYKETKYVSHMSQIEDVSFLNMQKDGHGDYYLHKIDLSGNEFSLFEVTDNIDEKFSNSADLKSFVKKYMRHSFFYNKDEIKYLKKGVVKVEDEIKYVKKDVVKVDNLKRTLNGIPVEFSSIKKVKSAKIGVLKKGIFVKVGANVIPVAAGTTVNYDSTKAIITRAQIKMDTRAAVKGGSILIKGGTYVDLAQNHIMNAFIKEDVIINNVAGAIPVKAMPTGNKPNIVFTSKGDLNHAYLSKEFSCQLDEQTINFPVGSRLDFHTGRINSANLSQNLKINLSGKEYELEGKPGATIKSFSSLPSSGVFSSIRVTNGHTIFVNDMDLAIKGSSYVVFTKKDGNYKIRKFDIGKAMTIDLHKKRKIKQKSVKFGKTLVVEDGKIIRTAL